MSPEARNEDYWERLEGDHSQTVLDKIREDAPEWDILSAVVAGEADDGTLFILVIRRRVNDEMDLILSERYYRYNPEHRSGGWLSNGIERRVSGSLGPALRVLYAATTNGDVSADDPMLIDSREEGLSYHPPELTEPIGQLDEDDDEDDPEETASISTEPEPDRKSWVRCRRCGEEIPEADAVQFGKGDLGDFWIHEDSKECDRHE